MIKEKSTLKKHEFEYESPDGDKWDITIVEHDERKYIQFQPLSEDGTEKGEKFVFDGPMLLDVADKYRSLTSSSRRGELTHTIPNIQAPNIIDHRAITEVGQDIQKQVDESMEKNDDSTSPVQALSVPQDEYMNFRTGVDVTRMGKVGDSPEKWKLKKENLKQWQKDALVRQQTQRLKKIGAKDII